MTSFRYRAEAAALPGTNVAALDVELIPADLEEIEEVAPKGIAAGERYNEASMRAVNG